MTDTDGHSRVATIKRTPRQWTESCRTCNGTGTVHEREHFSLWTPDEYERVQPLDPKHDAPADAYVCTTCPGATIFEACREAAEIAKQVHRPVAFEFNGTIAVIRADSDPVAVAKEWWKRAYGKTYEQDAANR